MPSISALPAATTLATSDQFAVIDATPTTRRATVQQILDTISSGAYVVAASNAPQSLKDSADAVCDGVDDQVEINAGLVAATRPSIGLGGVGYGTVQLVGSDFYIGNNGDSILMQTATLLRGMGPSTFIRPQYGTYDATRGAIELATGNVTHCQAHDFTVGESGESIFRSHGIMWLQNATGGTVGDGSLITGADPFLKIDNVAVLKPQGAGIRLGASGADASGARGTFISNCIVRNAGASSFDIDASDAKINHCLASSTDGGHGFYVRGGSCHIGDCKSTYGGSSTSDGFYISSSRATIGNCEGQDNGRFGFNIQSTNAMVTAVIADSNARIDTLGGGVNIGSSNALVTAHVGDRNQSPNRQERGIIFVGSPTGCHVTGISETPSGTDQIVGTPGANSFVRIVRPGTTVYTFG